MCAYLHAATSSAMKGPLTGLTGLELAVTQLRRCYVNKPFDILCQKLLSKLETLSLHRSYAYDTEVVTWDENRSGYSSAEVYSFFRNCRSCAASHLKYLQKDVMELFSIRLIELIPRLMLVEQPFIQQKCCWSCNNIVTPSIRLLQSVFTERSEEAYTYTLVSLPGQRPD